MKFRKLVMKMDCATKRIVLAILCFFSLLDCMGQFGAPYANSWINYDQKYVKIIVSENGLQKVPVSLLPTEFVNADKRYLQLFHRGREVSVVSLDEKEVVFYGELNDGSSDSVFYRPMSSRLNRYSSLYSDQSAYFLTIGKKVGKRSEVILTEQSSEPILQKFHLQNNLVVFNTVYSQSTEAYMAPDFINSFFEKGASRTGERLVPDSLIAFPFQLTGFVPSGIAPRLSLLVHGMTNNSRTVEVYAGKDRKSIRRLGELNLAGFIGKVFEADLRLEDFIESGDGFIFLRSVKGGTIDRFSVAFQNVTYSQDFKVRSEKAKYLELPASGDVISKIEFDGVTNDTRVLDITYNDEPRLLTRSGATVLIPRLAQRKTKLLLVNMLVTVSADKVIPTSFSKIVPSEHNYLVVTNELLKDGADKYAAYRATSIAGGYKPLVVKIKDLYNQFNYGEVSPLGIRRFVDYMVSDGNRDKHLFLIGKSINPVEKMVKELEECVPAVGYPGSDILLVEGLSGVKRDVPVIPVGRLMAISPGQVDDYLIKVKQYEQNVSGDFGWRKRILHLNGGHDANEISEFRDVLASLAPLVEASQLGGKVEAVIKQTGIEVEKVDITRQINEGVGMLSFFGHGSRRQTDLDFGNVTDTERGYSNTAKYPLMYFNGCGVGNIFRGLFGTNPGGADFRPLSLDWILSPSKGAIAVVANSYNSYLSPTVDYVRNLYETLFNSPNASQLSIGNVQKETIEKIVKGNANFYDIANIHQSLLQGDPALRLINISKQDYSLDRTTGITLFPDVAGQTIGSSNVFKVGVVISNLGRYEKNVQLPVKILYVFKNGGSETVTRLIDPIPYRDTLFVSYSNGSRLQRIEVVLDEANTLSELNKSNNRSELLVDWNVVSSQTRYPASNGKDAISPNMTVLFNNRIVRDREVFFTNPSVEIILNDDRFLQLDSTLIDVFMRKCVDETCSFTKIPYSSGLLNLKYLSSYSISLKLKTTNLETGWYELLVNAKDLSGNVPVHPFRIGFKIDNRTTAEFNVVCSPNPASDYLKFSMDDYEPDLVASINFMMYDVSGKVLEKRSLEAGQKEWYWFAKSSGLLVYRISVDLKGGETRILTGKVAVQK